MRPTRDRFNDLIDAFGHDERGVDVLHRACQLCWIGNALKESVSRPFRVISADVEIVTEMFMAHGRATVPTLRGEPN